jgi:hypothetical protein
MFYVNAPTLSDAAKVFPSGRPPKYLAYVDLGQDQPGVLTRPVCLPKDIGEG